jgi:hypothetical protein
MHRKIGYILAGLGAFFIVVAIVLPTYAAPSLVKWPLNQYLAATLQANNASYFSVQKLKLVSGITIDANYTFKGDASKGSSSTAVWNEFNYVHDVTNNVVIQLGTRTFAFDRKTAELVDCCGANVNGNPGVQQTGIAGYAFPIGTQQQNYAVFDAATGKPEAFAYSGTATVHGIQTYVFSENVGPTPAIDEPVPTNYQNHAVYYVDPVTGIPLDIVQHEILTARPQGTTLFNANLSMTPSSVSSLVNIDNGSRGKIAALQMILPLVVGILGAVLLIGGVLLARRGPREDVRPGDPVSATEPAAAPLSGAQDVTAELPAVDGKEGND